MDPSAEEGVWVVPQIRSLVASGIIANRTVSTLIALPEHAHGNAMISDAVARVYQSLSDQ